MRSRSLKVVWMGTAQWVLSSCKVWRLWLLYCQRKITVLKILSLLTHLASGQASHLSQYVWIFMWVKICSSHHLVLNDIKSTSSTSRCSHLAFKDTRPALINCGCNYLALNNKRSVSNTCRSNHRVLKDTRPMSSRSICFNSYRIYVKYLQI